MNGLVNGLFNSHMSDSSECSSPQGGANGTSGNNGANIMNGVNGLNVSHHVSKRQEYSNGISSQHHKTPVKSLIQPVSPDSIHDVVCVGFGPASLSVAVALHDALEAQSLPAGTNPSVLFLEKQEQFSWHSGMLLEGSKMQISFIKDLATLRNPRSHFTFLNYLHQAGRLVDFSNLGTFMPSRVEFESYLRWCASHFNDVVLYGREVSCVEPEKSANGKIETFMVTSRDAQGNKASHRARNVLIALGGQAYVPSVLPYPSPNVLHSSEYARKVSKVLPNAGENYRVAVIGAGQSAAEIFNNIPKRYPNAQTYLVMRQEFLMPSDDSPFVNSIFNPSYTNTIFEREASDRRVLLTSARATNYGVVRLDLIEHLYERMYDQLRELGPDSQKWPHQILGRHDLAKYEASSSSKSGKANLVLRSIDADSSSLEKLLNVDLVVAATGYQRLAHLTMLEGLWPMLPETDANSTRVCDGWEVVPHDNKPRKMEVTRDYKIKFDESTVAPGSGIYLQGCCERTHGLSDTLLSVLAVRSSEIVNSIFGGEAKA